MQYLNQGLCKLHAAPVAHLRGRVPCLATSSGSTTSASKGRILLVSSLVVTVSERQR